MEGTRWKDCLNEWKEWKNRSGERLALDEANEGRGGSVIA